MMSRFTIPAIQEGLRPLELLISISADGLITSKEHKPFVMAADKPRVKVGIEGVEKFNAGVIYACAIAALRLKTTLPGSEIGFYRVTAENFTVTDWDMLLGIGGEFEPKNNHYDPLACKTKRDNGCAYGLAGLLWYQFGTDIIQEMCPRPKDMPEEMYLEVVCAAAAGIDRKIFISIDAEDLVLKRARQALDWPEGDPKKNTLDGMHETKERFFTDNDATWMLNPCSVSYNNLGDLDLTNLHSWPAMFLDTMKYKKKLLGCMIVNCFYWHQNRIEEEWRIAAEQKAKTKGVKLADTIMAEAAAEKEIEKRRIEMLEDVYQHRTDKELLVLHASVPFLDWLMSKKDDQTLYVIMPRKDSDWRVHAVPVSKEHQEVLRRPFPVAWAELAERHPGEHFGNAIGIPSARFVNKSLMQASAKDLEGAILMAKKSGEIYQHEVVEAQQERDLQLAESPGGTLNT